MKVSDVVINILAHHGVKTVFGYQGGSITHLIDSIACHEDIEYVQSYNEQGASFAADAYARVAKEGLGVAVASNGPGATNLVTGIANAYCDSVPVVFITGQVHTFAMKGSNKTRQESFQEIDIISIVDSITKYAVTVMDENDIVEELNKAISIAKSGRKGPVLVDIPVDIQGKDVQWDNNEIHYEVGDHQNNVTGDIFDQTIALIKQSERPIILAGGGINQAGAASVFSEFVNRVDIPVVTSLQGLDSINHADPNFVGFIGPFGNRFANLALQNSDLLLVFGSRIDGRQTGKNRDSFANNAKIVHFDIDDAELSHFVNEDISIQGDIRVVLENLNKLVGSCCEYDFSAWRKQIDNWRYCFDDVAENINDSKAINPNEVVRAIGNTLPDQAIVCADVGQNQMWVAQSLRSKSGSIRILNSGGLGSMGYSLPACIGSYFASPASKVVGIMGDGGFQMNLQELEVIGSLRLPIALFIMNNESLGLIRDMHLRYYEGRCIGSEDGFSQPNFRELASAFGLGYACIDRLIDESELTEFMSADVPILVEVKLGVGTTLLPELLGSDSLDRQSPYMDLC